ncbi:helix-turn-helix transcriptional regulator [Modicisalibacter xianhensis]|nr:AraC family transcriptional regulator [Halomonas xianhensis]
MPATAPPMIDQQRLRALASPLVTHHRLHAPDWDRHTPLLEGSMRMIQPQPGMHVRLADVRDRYDLISEAELTPGVRLALVLSGQAQVRFGHHQLTLGPETNGRTTAQAMLVSLQKATAFQRLGQSNGHERTLTITLTPEWLRHYLATPTTEWDCQGVLGQHLALMTWTPSSAVLALAQRLFTPATEPEAGLELSEHLMAEGCALMLIGEALSAGCASARKALGSSCLREDRRLYRLREMIDSGEADELTQDALASRLGMSSSSLQRQFRASFGISLGRYLRERRLQMSHQALTERGISIEQAAALAGYTSAANFATAFKRQFGISPNACRR